MRSDIAISFVHEYVEPTRHATDEELPALWTVRGSESSVLRYPFVRNVSDFLNFSDFISGERPLDCAEDFQKLPRFGFTGLEMNNGYLYAASWNGVYEISQKNFEFKRIISNRLMNDLHCLCIHRDMIFTVLTGKDTVVVSDFSGQIVDYFTIGKDLNVSKDENILDVDWRFVSKQFRGATGYWHINHIQIVNGLLYLTSRNIGAFIVVDLENDKAFVRPINHKTPVLLHDGDLFDGHFYFTSIDGKIIIAADASTAAFNPREIVDNVSIFNRDLVSKIVRINETSYGKEPNWCRGMYVNEDYFYTTVDGRYDMGDSFGVLEFDHSGDVISEMRLSWNSISVGNEIRYATGFDIVNI